MTTQMAVTPTRTADPAARSRTGLLFGTLAVTSVLGLALTVLWPEPSGEWYAYGDVAPIRDRFFAVLTVLTVVFLLGVPAQALAAMLVTRGRGAGWATAGGAVLILGAAMQATGPAGWAMLYYYAGGPALDPATATAFMARIASDGLLYAVPTAGALLVAVGTAVQAVGLWRSRALPRWIPLASLVIVASFVLPVNGLAGALVQVPIAAAAVGMGWYAWRRTA
jgi:hypothetical protein